MGDFQRDYLSQTVFPCKLETMDGRPMGESMGMTMRDYFAGQALMGMLAHSRNNSGYQPRMGTNAEHWHTAISEEAYEIADAMLEARKK